jgi:hypothetical protein
MGTSVANIKNKLLVSYGLDSSSSGQCFALVTEGGEFVLLLRNYQHLKEVSVLCITVNLN